MPDRRPKSLAGCGSKHTSLQDPQGSSRDDRSVPRQTSVSAGLLQKGLSRWCRVEISLSAFIDGCKISKSKLDQGQLRASLWWPWELDFPELSPLFSE